MGDANVGRFVEEGGSDIVVTGRSKETLKYVGERSPNEWGEIARYSVRERA